MNIKCPQRITCSDF